MKFGEYSRALKDIEKFLELKPKNWRGYNSKGHILFGLGESDKAVQAFKDGIQVTGEYELNKCIEDANTKREEL